MKEHHVFIVPGLNDHLQYSKYVWATEMFWHMKDVVPHVILMNWNNGSASFVPRLEHIVERIDKSEAEGHPVSLVGCSAGGSAVINAFYERKNKIHRVINSCGRMRAGKNVFPTLEFAARKSPAFMESVKLCEARIPQLSARDKTKIMTIRPWFDEVVPSSTVPIDGAHNKRVSSVEHLLTGALMMTLYSRLIINFIKQP